MRTTRVRRVSSDGLPLPQPIRMEMVAVIPLKIPTAEVRAEGTVQETVREIIPIMITTETV